MRIYEYPLPAGAAEVTLMMPCPAVFLDVRTHSRTETSGLAGEIAGNTWARINGGE